MGNSVTGIMAGLWHWQLGNVNDTLKKHCARQQINHSWPSLIIHDRGKREKREHSSNKIHSKA
jgi:hypothetical protein